MKPPRTVVFALAAQGELFQIGKSSLAALANLICLSASQTQPLPRLGLCALVTSATLGKAQLKVKLRPSDVNLHDFHAATSKLEPNSSAEAAAVDGSQAALALQSLAAVLLKDSAPLSHAKKSIVLITDTLYAPEDFKTYLATSVGKGIDLNITVLCDGSMSDSLTAAADTWEQAEATYPDLTVTIVEVAGKYAIQNVANVLLKTCTESIAQPVIMEFNRPLLGDLRSIQLEACCEVQSLALTMTHAAVCACHRAPLVESRAGGEGSTGVSVCAVTGAALEPHQRIQDGRVVRIGDTKAGILHFATPLSIAAQSPAAGSGGSAGAGPAVLRVLNRVSTSHINGALLIGPSISLRAGVPKLQGAAAPAAPAVKVMVDGSFVDVHGQQLLELLNTNLRSNNQALVCSTSIDLQTGHSSLFRLHYMLLPAAGTSKVPSLCAFRMASMEELVPQPVQPHSHIAASDAEGVSLPASVIENIRSQLSKIPLEQNESHIYSSRVHETIEMLVKESKPAPKSAAAAAKTVPAAAAAAAGGAGASGGQSMEDKAGAGVAPKPAIASAGRGRGGAAANGSARGRGGRGGGGAAAGGRGRSTRK